MTDIEYVASRVSDQDRLLQVIEESSELTAAASKLYRIKYTDNPSPVDIFEAEANLLEEIADVNVSTNCYTHDKIAANNTIHNIEEFKTTRWRNRLERTDIYE